MNDFKRFLSFSKSERTAVVTITTAIIIIMIIKYLTVTIPPKKTYYFHDLDSIIALREKALAEVEVEILENEQDKRKQEESAFNNDEKKYQKDKFLPKNTQNNEKYDLKSRNNYPKEIKMVDINVTDTTLLQTLPGIGSSFASRIVSYRERLGGYYAPEQLLEVFGMDTTRYDGFKDFIFIDTTFHVNRLKINTDTFKTLLRHPYLEYDDVKKIVNHREQKGMISSWTQLVKVVGGEINQNLRYYVDYQ